MKQSLEDTFKLIEAAAAAGKRCPMNNSYGGGDLVAGNVTALAHAGRISVEVSGRNWRRVTILEGQYKGYSTQPNPDPDRKRVFLMIDKNGTFRNGKRIDSGQSQRPQPSLPRPLTREELTRE